ncbi:S-layer homology domain-containing protein [Sodalinema gerasimenkoae]|uniref:S-layer homology domain-containing protein n=1 Tax=Sodalinema gerasimenkoae TaxID=2862348 RepID=UPI00135A26BE|nr:S-layer homology domain-containing protein [Sodalinema gerasimenkoae]
MVRSFDLIVFGDEVPGILALVTAARELRQRTGSWPRSLLMLKGAATEPIGGHLVRGGLSYLDRSGIPVDLRQRHGLATFGDPPAIYQEFLTRSQVDLIALDPKRANPALRAMLGEVGAMMTGQVEIAEVLKTGTRISGLRLTRGETFLAKQFIDATVNAELAQQAGVKKLQGFATFGLPEAELPVTLCFETEGVTVAKVREVENYYLHHLLDAQSPLGQEWLKRASGGDLAIVKFLRDSLTNAQGQPLRLYSDRDFIDVRSRALSIGYHARRNKPFSLKDSGFLLDNGNVAILPGNRLSWNSLLWFVTGAEAEALARNQARPTEAILGEFEQVRRWFMETFGASEVRPAAELYIRHAGNIAGAVSPLSGAQMLDGGVPAEEALATFGYHFDVRGGIEGLGKKARAKGYESVSVQAKPVFNVGIRQAQVKGIPNFAVVSPASDFPGYASSAGRIVEYNVGVAQGLGIAAAIALDQGRQLSEITNLEVRQVLAQRGRLSKVYGIRQPDAAQYLASFEKALAPAVVEPEPAGELRDIAGHWAQPFIEALFEREIIAGMGHRRFMPDEPLTRAAFAAILAKAFDIPSVRDPQVFLDVSAGFWGYQAIRKANQMGFIAGFPNGSFRPEELVTRTQAWVAVVNGLNLAPEADVELLSFYGDRNQIPSYAQTAVARATQAELVANYPNRRQLQPQASMTRAEVAVTVYQALVKLGRLPEIESPYVITAGTLAAPPFTDLDGHWTAEFVTALTAKGLISGYPDKTFRPDAPLSRAAFATLLAKAFDPEPVREAIAFRDVSPGFWAAKAIQQVARGGFMSGVGGDRFAPNLNLQRLSIWLALVNGQNLGEADVSKLQPFQDAGEIPTAAKPAVAMALKRGLVVNYPEGDRLNPNRDATRGEVAVILYQALLDAGLWDFEAIDSPYLIQPR